MKTIELTRGKVALVDDADFDKLSQYTWRACESHGNWYAGTGSTDNKCFWFMHEMLLGPAPLGFEHDHIDRNGLNNQRNNLRTVTHSVNQLNRKLNSDNTSGTKGVTFSKAHGKWQAQIMLNGKNKYLGRFTVKADAIKARQEAEKSI